MDPLRYKDKDKVIITYVPNSEKNRKNPRKGRSLDRFMTSEDLLCDEMEVTHVSDNHYDLQCALSPHRMDHGSVRLTFNRKRTKIGPGQFKVDPNLIKAGCLDSVIKQVIFESNVFNCEIKEIVNAYEERNIIAVPILAEIVAIRDRRKATGNLADEEQRENELITNLNKANETPWISYTLSTGIELH